MWQCLSTYVYVYALCMIVSSEEICYVFSQIILYSEMNIHIMCSFSMGVDTELIPIFLIYLQPELGKQFPALNNDKIYI